MTVKSIKDLEEGEKILFEGRKTPLTVSDIEKDFVTIKGPQGGNYRLFEAENTGKLLICKPGNRDYASYVENLRKVGKWGKKDQKHWQHSKTGAEIYLEKNKVGFWTIATNNFKVDLDLPKYGFSDKENALEELEKAISDNPEG